MSWSQQDLAYAAGVQPRKIEQYERIGNPIEAQGFSWLEAVRAALERAGVTFSTYPQPQARLWDGYPITPRQCVAARKLLHLGQAETAVLIGLNQTQVSEFELKGHMARRYEGDRDRITDLKAALEAAGVEFTNGDVPGVRMRKAGP